MLAPMSFWSILQRKLVIWNLTESSQRPSKSTRQLPLAKKALMTTLNSMTLILPKKKMIWEWRALTTSKKLILRWPFNPISPFFVIKIFWSLKNWIGIILNVWMISLCIQFILYLVGMINSDYFGCRFHSWIKHSKEK